MINKIFVKITLLSTRMRKKIIFSTARALWRVLIVNISKLFLQMWVRRKIRVRATCLWTSANDAKDAGHSTMKVPEAEVNNPETGSSILKEQSIQGLELNCTFLQNKTMIQKRILLLSFWRKKEKKKNRDSRIYHLRDIKNL